MGYINTYFLKQSLNTSVISHILMKDIGYQILCLFKGFPNRELSTSEIIEKIFSSEYLLIKDILDNEFSSKDAIRDAKSNFASLQRKILYYTSKFEKDKTLKVTRIEGRGKKYFVMNFSEGGIIDIKGKKIIIEKPSVPALPISYLEDNHLAHRVEANHFFDRVNAIMLFNNDFDSLNSFYEYIYDLFSGVNDVIGILNFEEIILKNSVNDVINFLDKLNKELEIYNKRLCGIIDFTYVGNSTKIKSFFKKFTSSDLKGITFVFDVTGREFLEYEDLVESLVESYSSKSLKLTFKNDDLCEFPYILGKAGPYSFECDVDKLKQSDRRGIVCVQASIVLDVKKIISLKSAKALKDDIMICVKSLLYANAYHRKNLSSMFSKLTNNSQVFINSKNCIRFWNYEVFDNLVDNLVFLDTLLGIRGDVFDFSRVEEIIYLSCGMPTNFKVNFSIAYKRFKGSGLKCGFDKIRITDIKDFYTDDIKQSINYFEKGFKLFDGGHEIRFYRTSNVDAINVVRELNLIMNSFKLPFFCYNFTGKLGLNMSLDSFMD